MSSFGDGNVRTEIEESLNYIFQDKYENTDEGKLKFTLDVMAVLNYICE